LKVIKKDGPRIIIFDDFNDYNGDLKNFIKSGDDKTAKRWIGDIERGLFLDEKEKYSGEASLKIKIPKQSGAYGNSISQWVDARALRGEPMNSEPMTAKGFNVTGIPEGGLPVDTNVRPGENGFTELYARAMVKYAKGFNRYGHNGIHFSGGYSNRPHPGWGAENNPGSAAGYRSNGFDRFLFGLEPEFTHRIHAPRPGTFNVYYYGAEQLGASGNHMFPSGLVYGSTGGDNDLSLSRKDGVNGFTAYPNIEPSINEWFCLEFFVKLNTVIKNGISPGPNEMPVWTPTSGPQEKPENCEILHDGEIKAWVNGEQIMHYTDVVTRYTNEMVIDLVSFSTYFGDNTEPDSAIWYDQIVVATEYICYT
jgi:hypothetical protein